MYTYIDIFPSVLKYIRRFSHRHPYDVPIRSLSDLPLAQDLLLIGSPLDPPKSRLAWKSTGPGDPNL